MFEVVGVLLGLFTGLTPGIHSNTLAQLTQQAPISIEAAAFIIIGAALAHTIVDIIPATLIGVPDASLALLPQQRLFHEGRAFEVIRLAIVGGVTGGVVSLVAYPILSVLQEVSSIIKVVAPFVVGAVLIFVCLYSKRWCVNLFVATLAGVAGIYLLDSTTKDPLFVLFTGLFGTSALLMSWQCAKSPVQVCTDFFEWPVRPVLLLAASLVASVVCMMLPSLGSAQAAFMISVIGRGMDSEQFVFILGALNTMNQVLALLWWDISGSTRTGTAVAMDAIGADVTVVGLVLVSVIAILVAGGVGLVIGRLAMELIQRIPARVVVMIVLVGLVMLAFVLSGLRGLLWMVICTCIGIVALILKARKSALMACIVVPYVVNSL